MIITFRFLAAILLATGCSTARVSSISPNSLETLEKPYVVLVSLDGYRADYTDKIHPPYLTQIRDEGASVKSLIPAFPSKTFPNHLSIITGRYPAHHGIVANSFFDFSRPPGKQHYTLGDRSAVNDGGWYLAPPLWVVAEKQGMRTACFFWPGSEAEIDGVRPSYTRAYDGHVPNRVRVDQVIDWLKLPEAERPHFITLYMSDIDSAGHSYGPDSAKVKEAVLKIDQEIGYLRQELGKLNLPVNLAIVSDHGMIQIDPKKLIVLDEQADFSGLEVAEEGPIMLIYGETKRVDQLEATLSKKAKHFRLYRKSKLPAFMHAGTASDQRFGDLVISADAPYSVVLKKSQKAPVGTHGYEPQRTPEMHAIFYAVGPGVAAARTLPSAENVHVFPFLTSLLGLDAPSTDGRAEVLAPALKQGHAMARPSDDKYLLRGVQANQAEFEAFVAKLKPTQRNWRCKRHLKGGITSWEQQDASGQWWRIEADTSDGVTSHSVKELTP